MALTEPTVNDALAKILSSMRATWRESGIVTSENTQKLRGNNRRPDIIIAEPYVYPIIIETEFSPASTVEEEATSRLGEQLRDNGRTIYSSIAVRIPARIKECSSSELIEQLMEATDFEYALYEGETAEQYTRWPEAGWLSGNLQDMVVLCQRSSIPETVVEQAANILSEGIADAANLLSETTRKNPGVIKRICEELKQADNDQTYRMAMAILINAFIFQSELANGPGKLISVKSTSELDAENELNKTSVLKQWNRILEVNYWPIFDISKRILGTIPPAECKQLITVLTRCADTLIEKQVTRSHDLTGAVFQKLIADRKFLAAYYTTPSAAALLVGLALNGTEVMPHVSWDSAKSISELKIGDFACGTGTLLSAAYTRISNLHEFYGGNSRDLHVPMMSNGLVGCDVLPAAAHLTASMLSGVHPTVKYEDSSILTVPYGLATDGNLALGSIDLLDQQGNFEVLSITSKSSGGVGESSVQIWDSLIDGTFDFVIMNPPYVRDTGQEADKVGIPNPMFAAFDVPDDVQRIMGKKSQSLTQGTTAHGNAGLASIFFVIADRKVKVGGTLALVMPLSLMSGTSWQATRDALIKNYSNLSFVTICGKGQHDSSFSADTGMGECLITGIKNGLGSKNAKFIILYKNPSSKTIASEIARQVKLLTDNVRIRDIKDGPFGGTNITFGTEKVGYIATSAVNVGEEFKLNSILDLSLAQSAYQLEKCNFLWLPSMREEDKIQISICRLDKIATFGPYHADVSGKNGLKPRGPFELEGSAGSQSDTYPILWAHEADSERCIQFEHDKAGIVCAVDDEELQEVINTKAAEVLDTASHCHFNQNFQFNSQSTAFQFTSKPVIGGRAWLSVKLSNPRKEKAMALWGNTSLGLLLYWWHANKQQSGRGNIVKTALISLPVLNVDELNNAQLEAAELVFNDLKAKPLKPFNEIASDETRKELDKLFFTRVLNLDEELFDVNGSFELLVSKFNNEPSIQGSKLS